MDLFDGNAPSGRRRRSSLPHSQPLSLYPLRRDRSDQRGEAMAAARRIASSLLACSSSYSSPPLVSSLLRQGSGAPSQGRLDLFVLIILLLGTCEGARQNLKFLLRFSF